MKNIILIIIFLSSPCFSYQFEKLPCSKPWEDNEVCLLKRLWVPHGWLILYEGRGEITFYPDEKHEWKIQ